MTFSGTFMARPPWSRTLWGSGMCGHQSPLHVFRQSGEDHTLCSPSALWAPQHWFPFLREEDAFAQAEWTWLPTLDCWFPGRLSPLVLNGLIQGHPRRWWGWGQVSCDSDPTLGSFSALLCSQCASWFLLIVFLHGKTACKLHASLSQLV